MSPKQKKKKIERFLPTGKAKILIVNFIIYQGPGRRIKRKENSVNEKINFARSF